MKHLARSTLDAGFRFQLAIFERGGAWQKVEFGPNVEDGGRLGGDPFRAQRETSGPPLALGRSWPS